jgi:hypothetical protein
MSAFIVNTSVMAKVVTAILLNFDSFDGEKTHRAALLAAPTDAQKEAGTKIGRNLFLMNRRALRARYGCSTVGLPDFVFGKWAAASPVEQFKAMCCLLYQCGEGEVPNSQLYNERRTCRNTTRPPGATEPRPPPQQPLRRLRASELNPLSFDFLDASMQQCSGAAPSRHFRLDGEKYESTIHCRFAERKDRPHSRVDCRAGIMLARLRALREWLLR